MALEFVIPLCREDLLKQRDSGSYVVLDTPLASELTSKVDGKTDLHHVKIHNSMTTMSV